MTDPARIGERIWAEAMQEGVVVGALTRVRHARFLEQHAPEEAATLTQILDEEAMHGRRFRALARRYCPQEPEIARMYPVAKYPLHEMLWFMNQVERMSRYAFALNILLHTTVTQDADAAAMYTEIQRDEEHHIAWGRRVLTELRRVPEFRASFRTLARSHLVPRLYRQVFGDRSWYAKNFGIDAPIGQGRLPC